MSESYEIGNPNLDTESAVGVEIIVRKTVGKVTGQFSAFHTKFNDYIFLEEKADVRDSDGNLKNDTVYPELLGADNLVFLLGQKVFPSRNTKESMLNFKELNLRSIG